MANEKRLIDANALLEKHTCDVYGAYDDSCIVKAVFVPYIKGAPTVDAVEVVRCKDCKHWIHMEDGMGDCINGRFHVDGQVDPTMDMNDFCSCGEKRGEDNAK